MEDVVDLLEKVHAVVARCLSHGLRHAERYFRSALPVEMRHSVLQVNLSSIIEVFKFITFENQDKTEGLFLDKLVN